MGVVTATFPPETVDALVEECGVREQRRRELPADVMVYYTMGLWLWRDVGYVEVLKQMTDSLRSARWASVPDDFFPEVPNAASIAKARQRIGSKVMERLFQTSTGLVDPGVEEVAGWHGLRIAAVDGATLDVPDTPDNREAFGVPSGGAFPQIRCVAVADVGARNLLGAALGGYTDSEKALCEQVLESFGPGMVAVADRGFCGYDLFGKLRATGADVVMRAGSQFPLPVIEALEDGSWISELRKKGKPPIRVRVMQYSVTARDRLTGTETIGEVITLVTNLMDVEAYPIEDFPDLYEARWRVEEVFDEVKTDLRGGTEQIFRSRTPEGVRAEFWGLLCLYQAICDLIGHVALTAKLRPDRISFAAARSFTRRSVAWIGPAFSPLDDHDDAPPGREGTQTRTG
jgi:hypothetical protein